MTTAPTAHVLPHAQQVNSDIGEERHISQQSHQHAPATAGVRYALLVGIALLLTYLTFAMLDSIRETEAEIDTIYKDLGSSLTW